MKIIAIAGKARNGKTTVANIFKNIAQGNNERAIVVSYAGYVKYMATTYYGWSGEKDEYGRTLLQKIGDGVRNTFDESFWITRLMSDLCIFGEDYDYVIIDDCRYPNEILEPQKVEKTYSIKVIRTDFESDLTEEQKMHKSEIALDDFKFDYTIMSESGEGNLINPVKELYKNIRIGD